MLFFQSQQKRNCRSANVTRRNYRVKRQVTQPSDNNSDLKKQKGKQNGTPNRSSYQAPLSCVDPYTEQMKFLIEHNSNYFQSKVKITDKIRPNQYRFKIPTKTPVTMYKKNFTNKQKDVSVDNLKLNRNNLSEIMKKTTHDQNFMLKSTYQNQFGVNKENSKLSKHKICKNKYKENKFVYDDEVPRFLETQNNCFYLNWGGKNSAISLKPSYQTVSTNFPFEGKTVYKNDFQGKPTVPSKIVVPESSFSKLTNTFMVNNTCYSREFSKKEKRPQVQKSYKPKHIPMKKSQIFKGSTQYRSQFLNNRSNSIDFSQQIAKQDLQTLILNL